MVKIILAVVIALAAFVGAFYVGFYLMFIGGIIDIYQNVKADTLTAGILAIDFIRVALSGVGGGVVAFFGFGTAFALIKSA